MRGAILGSLFNPNFSLKGFPSSNQKALVDKRNPLLNAMMVLAFNKALIELPHEKHRSKEKDFLICFQNHFAQLSGDSSSDFFQSWLDDENQLVLLAASLGAFFKTPEAIAKGCKQTIGNLSFDKALLKKTEKFALLIHKIYQGAVKSEIAEFYLDTSYCLEVKDNFFLEEELPHSDDPMEWIPPKPHGITVVPSKQIQVADLSALTVAVQAFLQSDSFESVLLTAWNLSEGNNLVGAFAGAIADAYYGVPINIEKKMVISLPNLFSSYYYAWKKQVNSIHKKTLFQFLTKYHSRMKSDIDLFSFQEEFLSYIKEKDKSLVKDYQILLKNYGIDWTEKALTSLNPKDLDVKSLLACIMAVLRANYFSQGVLKLFVKKGVIDRWLKCLQTLDKEEVGKTLFSDIAYLYLAVESNSQIETFKMEENNISISIKRGDSFSIEKNYRFFSPDYINHVSEICMRIREALLQSDWQDTCEVNESAIRFRLKAIDEDEVEYEHYGIYDRIHLPDQAWLAVMEGLKPFFTDFVPSLMLDSSQFMKAIREGELKYCKVEFPRGSGRLYYYRTDDLSLEVGDKVLVPVGEKHQTETVKIRKIEFYRWDNTPYPLEKTKKIITRFTASYRSLDEEEPDYEVYVD